MSYKVKFEHVTKKYKMYSKSSDKLKDLFFRNDNGDYHYALNNVSFEVPEGEIVGIVGLNGSGKSTLSNLIAGVTIPNKGKVTINGSASLIAISSGLNNQLTGIENIELKALMMGLTKDQIREITPKVIEFADIGKFIYQPVKTYSSGMKSRIGFAISVHINPDILVIDEALSVGDQTFTKKCLDKMNEFKDQGKTIFFISHSLTQVKNFCTKVIWLHYGKIKDYGNVNEVLEYYNDFLKNYNQMSVEEKNKLREEQALQFQHGLLQEHPVVPPRGEIRKSKSKKKGIILFGTIFIILVSAIVMGLNYKGILSIMNGTKNKEGFVQGENATKEKKVKAELPIDKKYMVNSNDISIRKEPSMSSERLALAQFGEIYKVPNNHETNNGWIQIVLPNGEKGWINGEYVKPFLSNNEMIEDAKLDNIITLINRVYGLPVKSVNTYVGKSLSELEALYPNNLISSKTIVGKTEYRDGKVKFVISGSKVVEMSFQDISMSISKLQEILGKESINNDFEKNYLFETKRFYVIARSDKSHQEIQTLTIMSKE
ncbi:teichoic acids export ABC transporter ATP-binding subunit TagH [Bacillus wiedmannii]|uniref:teichoic acids export ABC transporter ATP-binding subunit TagH n=1 Tax=Bacillus wiedmannii TaxID=1890302 RepID=UPI000BF89608|nr:teichoic acids export ABC transporter ATP-binding subunit TagH [Bacillus wiedmannii]PGD63406.1 teichoic acid export protein ATP-binding subunit [Bacillus wiedmannii]